ncbi:MAG: molybdenum ABC transporter ATP-binding protein [Rhodospirillaceae bacterium]|nr:molybdenum ABC transporter ATP-binding protein [Rhodospirillales bacterium]
MLDLSIRRQQGDFRVEVDLAAGAGVTALFGRSGSGKSSVINMVAGLYRPDSGRIKVDGKVLFDSESGIDLAPERRRLGYVFQDARLFPHLSVHGNLIFGMNRVPVPERRIGFDDVVQVLGIGHLLDRRPSKLSGGEKQRVAIGRALLASPRILLMDEPLAALDSQRKAELLPFIGKLARQFATPILYVSHSMDEVLRLSDTLVLMDDGKAAAVGPVEELLSRTDLRPLTGRYEAGAVIRATVAGHDATYGISRLAFTGGTLLVAKVNTPVGTPVRLRIHARDVSIAIDAPSRISVRNVLPAVVKSVRAAEGWLTDVVLDCGGTDIWAQITAHAQAHLNLVPGMRVNALIKALTIARGDVADRA